MEPLNILFPQRSPDLTERYNSNFNHCGVSIARYTHDQPGFGMTPPSVRSNEFMAVVQLRNLPRHYCFRNGKPALIPDALPSSLTVHDFRDEWQSELFDPFDTFNLIAPWSVFDGISDDLRLGKIERLDIALTSPARDRSMFGMAQAMLPLLSSRQRASRLFLDHILTSSFVYLAVTYGGAELSRARPTGGLTMVQQRRLAELLDARLGEDLGIADLADVCGSSPRNFHRAFQKTFGETPHRWRTRKRIERAKQLLADQRLRLVEIASQCGFADQSHFGRVFAYFAGCSPGAYRKGMHKH